MREFLKENVDHANAALHTDESPIYRKLGREFSGGHHAVNHAIGEYARGSVHSNTAESFNGLFKRSIQGSWHHISEQHIGRYLGEQCFRWSNRGVKDRERAVLALGRVSSVCLYYRTPQGSEGQAGLVSGA